MIDWSLTEQDFGLKSSADFDGVYRPKVWCRCDKCQKPRIITIRVKANVIAEQMGWRCPSCVGLTQSTEISQSMVAKWQEAEYRQNQMTIKQQPEYIEIQSKKSRDRWLDDAYRSKLETGVDREQYLKSCHEKFGNQFEYDMDSFGNWMDKISITCTACGLKFSKLPLSHLTWGTCPACRLPIELKSIAINQPIINDRTAIKPFELDLFWPKQRFALEYHGLYWHSYNRQESVIEKFRHQQKALKCIESNIKLFQVFDYEWSSNGRLIRSMISNAFGESKSLMARKLSISPITNEQAAPFFIANHLQGHRPARHIIALIGAGEIKMAMSFNKHGNGFEIIRMATLIGHHVCGGASRLLNHFRQRNQGKPIYTFADLRYSTATTYRKLGFTQLHITNPGYFYYKGRTILSRQQCQKHRLGKLLPNFNPELSEAINMFANGYRRVWDAGHIKLKLD